jgi:hypothetical protein
MLGSVKVSQSESNRNDELDSTRLNDIPRGEKSNSIQPNRTKSNQIAPF